MNMNFDIKTINNIPKNIFINFTGEFITARDGTLKKIFQDKNFTILKNKIIYLCGPTPNKNGVIGSCGPTTTTRMENYFPKLIDEGIFGILGKGGISKKSKKYFKQKNKKYFLTIGGVGALLSKYVEHKEVIKYEELGSEAMFLLKVKNFPIMIPN